MQILRSIILFGVMVAAPCAMAQDASPAGDAGTSQSTSATATDLFPAGGVQPSTTQANGNGGGGGHHNGGGGGHSRSGRHRDVLVSQADADPLELRVQYRRAKTIALARDTGLAALLHQAAGAATDNEKRAYLKAYYLRLFASVRRIDPSPAMKAHVELLNAVAEQNYNPKRREVGGDEDLVNGRGRGRRGRVE